MGRRGYEAMPIIADAHRGDGQSQVNLRGFISTQFELGGKSRSQSLSVGDC